MTANLKSASTDGYQVSVAGENVVEKILIEDWTVKNFKEISLIVDKQTKIKINDDKEETVLPNLGYFRSTQYEPVEKLEFLESGVNYFISLGY